MSETPLKLVTLPEVARDETTADIVETLEDWLERAKKGEFSGVGLVATRRDDAFTTRFTRHANMPELVGALATLQWRIIHNHTVDD
jgi:hypothetical protein